MSRAPSRPRARPTRRYAYVPRVDGPHGRLGVLWFLVAVGACVLGQLAIGVLFGVLATVAALQTATAWRRAGWPDDRLVAGVAAGAVSLAALVGVVLAAAVVLAGLVASFVAAAMADDARGPAWARGVRTARAWALPAVAAASVAALARADLGAMVIILVLVSGYEVGDYLVGTGATGMVEGPVAGMAAVFVLTFAEAVFQLGPFDARGAWVFGGLVAVLAPLGAPLASALAPAADADVPALRRLDAWLVVAPVCCLLLWDYLA